MRDAVLWSAGAIVAVVLAGCASTKPTTPGQAPDRAAGRSEQGAGSGAAAPRGTGDATVVKTSQKPINRRCPTMQEHRIDPHEVYLYKGVAIGFCCPDCAEGFRAMSEAERDEVLEIARTLTE